MLLLVPIATIAMVIVWVAEEVAPHSDLVGGCRGAVSSDFGVGDLLSEVACCTVLKFGGCVWLGPTKIL